MKKKLTIAGVAMMAVLSLSACDASTELKEDVTGVIELPSKAQDIADAQPTELPSVDGVTKTAKPTTPASKAPASKAPEKKAPAPKASGSDAAAALAKLPVSDQTMSGYDRSSFRHWKDTDNNGCDARDDALIRFMPKAVLAGCEVVSGNFQDPYSGQTIAFDNNAVGGGIDIDHVVALSAGWKTGMGNASDTVREQFANDPLNLMPTDAGVNRYKSDKDASEWVPSDGNNGELAGGTQQDCNYVAHQVAVKTKYSLWVTSAEKSAMSTVLADCPDQKLPADGTPVVMDKSKNTNTTVEVPAKKQPAAPKASAPKAAGGVDPDMGTCAKAKAAGYGPYTKSDKEYGFYRDGDGDGTVCE